MAGHDHDVHRCLLCGGANEEVEFNADEPKETDFGLSAFHLIEIGRAGRGLQHLREASARTMVGAVVILARSHAVLAELRIALRDLEEEWRSSQERTGEPSPGR